VYIYVSHVCEKNYVRISPMNYSRKDRALPALNCAGHTKSGSGRKTLLTLFNEIAKV